VLGLSVWAGHALAQQSTWSGSAAASACLWWAGRFSLSATLRRRKPAFVDDVTGLIVGPLFVVAELAFLLGMRHELKEQIEARAGGAANPKRAA
jgi:uncharacterized membrane protein YGL010W